MLCLKIAGWVANSVDPDEMPHSAVSHLGLYCLLRPVCPNTYGKYGSINMIIILFNFIQTSRKLYMKSSKHSDSRNTVLDKLLNYLLNKLSFINVILIFWFKNYEWFYIYTEL